MEKREVIKTVWCTFSFVGFHYWPLAPKEVGYLSDVHRHEFQVRLTVYVHSNDRQIEFHLLKGKLINACQPFINGYERPYAHSCESIAENIATDLIEQKVPVCQIMVSEDGECGATLCY